MFDYTSVTAEAIKERLDQALTKADGMVDRIVDPATPSTYEDILAPIDEIEDLVTKAYGTTAFMGYVHPERAVRDAGNDAEERIQKWAVDLLFRSDFYQAVKAFSETEEATALTGERRRLLDFTMRDLRKSGHELSEKARDEVKQLTQRLVEVGVLYQRNIDEHQDFLNVTRGDLEGMPESYIEGLKPGDEDDSFQIGMSYPDVVPFMENSSRRDLRRQLSAKFNSRATETNRPLLEEAVGARQRIAELFEQPSWAHHKLETQMAKDPESVRKFYAALVPGLTELGQSEVKTLKGMLAADNEDGDLGAYDFRYYDTQLRKRDYGVDPMEVARVLPPPAGD